MVEGSAQKCAQNVSVQKYWYQNILKVQILLLSKKEKENIAVFFS